MLCWMLFQAGCEGCHVLPSTVSRYGRQAGQERHGWMYVV